MALEMNERRGRSKDRLVEVIEGYMRAGGE